MVSRADAVFADLVNGRYTFKEPRDFGATKDYHLIFFLGESEAVRIDTENIVEIFERAA